MATIGEYSPQSLQDRLWREQSTTSSQVSELLESARELMPQQWRQGMMFSIRQELINATAHKAKFLNMQKQSSLLVEVNEHKDQPVERFAALFSTLVKMPMPPELHSEQLDLLKLTIQESIIIEWPRMIPGIVHSLYGDDDTEVEVDFAPLIHRARTAVKCRTSQPTMRVRVCAIAPPNEEAGMQSVVVEAFFRATLVKHTSDPSEHQVAGRLILTQREGTPATKTQDQNGATVNEDGKLIASQAAPNSQLALLTQYGEKGKTTPFKYEQGALCATFPQMGVTLNSMVDRRQLTTRYAIQVEVAINVDNKLLVTHTVYSHPFLIAITNDQTEPLLLSIFWQRLLNSDQLPETSFLQAESSTRPEPAVPWRILKKALRNFVKAQYPQARSLYSDELFHIQCMLFLPRAIRCEDNERDLAALEVELFGSLKTDCSFSGARKIKYRLLREEVCDTVLVEKREVMNDKCISIADKTSELGHTLWQWLYKATEMVMDVGHKLCPTPATIEKKAGTKTKKQQTATEDYPTMVRLFNSRIITFSGLKDVLKMFKTLQQDSSSNRTPTMAIMIRFCDENAGYLSLAYTNRREPLKPLMGVLSLEQIKEFKQGLPEVLFDEVFPKKFDRIAFTEYDRTSNPPKLVARVTKKNVIFSNYKTLRSQNEYIVIKEDETIRINSLTGEELNPSEQPNSPLQQMQSQLNQSAVSHIYQLMNLLASQSSGVVELPTPMSLPAFKKSPSSNASSAAGSTAGTEASGSSNRSLFSQLSLGSFGSLPSVSSSPALSNILSVVIPRPNELKGAPKRKLPSQSWLSTAVYNKRAVKEELQSSPESPTDGAATNGEDEPLNLVITKNRKFDDKSVQSIYPTPLSDDETVESFERESDL